MSSMTARLRPRRDALAFIHWGAWGDLYVATAALRSAIDANPGAPAFVIGSDKWLRILDPDAWPEVAGVVASDKGLRGDVHERDPAGSGWRLRERDASLVRFYRRVRVAYNVRTESLRFAWAPFLARVPRRHGTAPGPVARVLYTHRAPWLGKDPEIHERDRMLQVVEAPDRVGELAAQWRSGLGLPRLKARPDRGEAERLARAPFGSYWLLNPTASRREKAWPAENFRELYERLAPRLRERGLELRILGAPTETDWLRETIPAGVDPSVAIVQPPDVQRLLDVLAGARALVANTSSTQFLAPGLGVPVITLMGRAHPAIWGPLGPHDVVIRGEIDPELSGDLFAQERDAYRSVSVERVLEACDGLLERKPASKDARA